MLKTHTTPKIRIFADIEAKRVFQAACSSIKSYFSKEEYKRFKDVFGSGFTILNHYRLHIPAPSFRTTNFDEVRWENKTLGLAKSFLYQIQQFSPQSPSSFYQDILKKTDTLLLLLEPIVTKEENTLEGVVDEMLSEISSDEEKKEKNRF